MRTIKGLELVLITIAVGLGTFMNVLDISIANVAIPTIAGNMAVSVNQATWIITSFTASTAIMLPLTGWLARRFGEVRLFVVATSLFTLMSVLCGLATSLPMLVFFRVLQGIAAGPMIPISQTLLLNIYGPAKQAFATAVWAMVTIIAPVLGPMLGGYLTDTYSWPWIFYINLPVGIISVVFIRRILTEETSQLVKLPMDYVGLILLAIGVASLQILLDKGHDLDWLASPFIVVLIIVAIVTLTFFVIWELTDEHPIVDLSLFKNINFTIGCLLLALGFLAYFGVIVILPLWLQTQMNYTPTWAGLVTAPFGVLPLFLSPLVGYLIGKVDLRILASIGFIAFALGSFWLAGLNLQVSPQHIAFIRLLQGIGIPFFFLSVISITLSHLAQKDYANASGLSNFIRVIGGSFGTSIFVSMWDHREAIHQSKLVENLALFNHQLQLQIQQLQTAGLSLKASYARIMHGIVNQAYMLATNDIFWLSGIIFLGLMFLCWLARPPFVKVGGGVGAE